MRNKIIGMIVILLGISLMVGAYFLGKHDGEQAPKNGNDQKEDVKKQDEGVVDKGFDTIYLTYIPSVIRNKLSDSFFVYQNKKVSIDDLNIETIYAAALNMLSYDDLTVCQETDKKAHNNCDLLVSPALLTNKVRELYGKNYTGKAPMKIVGNGGISCKLNTDIYECMNGGEINTYNDYTDYFFYGNEYMNVVDFQRYEKQDNYVYAYVKFVNVRINNISNYNVNDLNTFKMKVYENTVDNTLLDNDLLLGSDFYKENDTEGFAKKIAVKYFDKAPLYKHAYKIDKNGSYVWEYTERVSE